MFRKNSEIIVYFFKCAEGREIHWRNFILYDSVLKKTVTFFDASRTMPQRLFKKNLLEN